MFDVVAIGELLIDFTPVSARTREGASEGHSGMEPLGRPYFEQNPGGAPANVAVAAAQMGKRAAFIGQVGEDAFGNFLRETLASRGVDVSGLLATDRYPTTLAFVHLDPSGERSFSFYRNPSADVMLEPDDVKADMLSQTRLFHFGSVSMTADPSRTATLAAVQAAREAGAIITYDPNLRLSLWKSGQEAKDVILDAMQYADVLKVSDEELTFLTGETDLESGVQALRRYHECAIVLVTRGAEGCYYSVAGGSGSIASYSVQAIDTTGAGDAFVGAFIAELLDALDELSELADSGGREGGLGIGPEHRIARLDLSRIPEARLQQAIRFANASGALTTTRRGGIPALPTKQATIEYLEHHIS